MTNDSIRTGPSLDSISNFTRGRAVTLDVTLAARQLSPSPVTKVMDQAEVDNPPFGGPKGNTKGNDPPFGPHKMVALSKTLATLATLPARLGLPAGRAAPALDWIEGELFTPLLTLAAPLGIRRLTAMGRPILLSVRA